MPKFIIGDRVERIGSLVPEYMRNGTVVRVIPNADGLELFTEYKVNFDDGAIGKFYATELCLVEEEAKN